MNISNFNRRRAVLAVRMGDAGEVQDQLERCHAFAQRHDISIRYPLRYDGSPESFAAMIAELVNLKDSGADFDRLLIRQPSDFQGGDRQATLEAVETLRAAGVTLIAASRDRKEDDHELP